MGSLPISIPNCKFNLLLCVSSPQVDYVVRYTPAGEIVNCSASVMLGSIRGRALTMEQQFTISFVQVKHYTTIIFPIIILVHESD